MSTEIDNDAPQTQIEIQNPIDSSTVSATKPEKKWSKLLGIIKRFSPVITITFSLIALVLSYQANEISRTAQQENHELELRQSEYNARGRHLEQLEGYVSQVSSIYNKHIYIKHDITDEDRDDLIDMYESLEQLLNHDNQYYDEFKSEFIFSINQIDSSITGSNGTLPNTGSLPNLEDAFAEYQAEEYRLISVDFK